MATAHYLDKLNPAQRSAVMHGEDPLLIIAGAGTGKTMTLAHRVARLIEDGADPERILLLTFTRRAADEMSRRVETIVRESLQSRNGGPEPGNSRRVRLTWSGTFHSIGNRMLRRFAANLGLDPAFSVLDQGDAADLIDVVRHELGFSSQARRFPKKETCLAIYSRCMNTEQALDDVLQTVYPWCLDWSEELRQLFRAYVERKQATQSLDYDDLLSYWAILVGDPQFQKDIEAWFDHVLVDEYQDTNRVQARIVRALKPDGRGVTVVGDDAQSIYSFRAASVENILEFPDQYAPRAAKVTLESNYRSSQRILDSANQLLKSSKAHYEKELKSEVAEGQPPHYVTVEDGDAEADYVVESILAAREEGLRLKDQAVLFRNAHHSDRVEVELVRRNIPYVKFGGLKFLEAAHIKDVLAILKWADNPKNEVAAFRVMKLLQGVGPKIAHRAFRLLHSRAFDFACLRDFRMPTASQESWEGLVELMGVLRSPAEGGWQAQFLPLIRWYKNELERIYDAAETRLADVEQLEQISARYASRERFLSELTLDPPQSTGDQSGDPRLDEDYLILSTVHSAKGQEWDSVFVLNVTDGNFPSEFSTGSASGIEEERRLMYVAMTRAKQSLSLIAPMKFYVVEQQRYGDRHVYGARSRFMDDALLATMRTVFHGDVRKKGLAPSSNRRVDAAASMRSMWS